MKNRYFNYLCRCIDITDGYHHLLGALDCIYFYPIVANDDNRAEDGKQLRETFCDLQGEEVPSDFLEETCSVLEMLIALSNRLEFETSQSRWEKTPSEWFWILIDNIGLSFATDEAFMALDTRVRVVAIVNKWLRREYNTNGDGGIFPLFYTKHDQRRVEIWYQMTEYILENYPI